MNRSYFSILLVSIASFCFAQQAVELVVPTGHTSQIQKITVDDDTTIVASIQNTEEIIIWDYQTTSKRRVLRHHASRVNDLLIDQDHLISGGDDKQVFVWDIPSKKIIGQLSFGEQVFSIFVEDDHQLIILGEKGKILRWNYLKNEKGDSTTVTGSVRAATLSRNSKRLIIATKEKVYLLNEADLSIRVETSTKGEQINAILSKSENIFFGTGKGELLTTDTSLVEQKRLKVFDFRLYHIAESSTFNELILTGRDQSKHLKTYQTETEALNVPDLELGNESRLSEGGIRTLTVTGQEKIFLPDFNYGISSFSLPDFKMEKSYQGLSFPVNDIAISNNEKVLAVASSINEISLHDLSGVNAVKVIDGHEGGVSSVAFHPTDSLLASVGFDNKLKVWSVATGKLKYTYDVRGKYVTTPIQFNVSGQYLIQKTDPDYFELFDLGKSKSKKLKIKGGIDYKFAQNGQILIFQTRSGYLTYDAINFKELSKFDLPRTNGFDVQGKTIAVLTDEEIIYYDLNFFEKATVKTPKRFDNIYLHPNEEATFSTINSVESGSSYRDYSLKYLADKDAKLESLEGHQGFISNIKFIKNGRFMMSSSKDGQIIIRDFSKEVSTTAKFIPLNGGEWVALTPIGIYDASNKAYNSMHYTRGKEEFDLAQLKDLYYEPKLLPRVLEYTSDPLPERKPLSELPSHPEIEVKHPQVNNGVLGVNVKNTGGGVSYVVIKINGKEVLREIKTDSSNPNPASLALDYTITGHPFMKSKGLNKVSVKAYNSDGSMSSPEESLFVFGKKEIGKAEIKPKLFSLVVGTDDYPGETMDLTYAGKDANDFADALGVVGNNYYQDGNTQITRLNTLREDKSYWPTKANIQRELDRIEKEATAQDVLVIYMSGHGINYGEETEDFYYLTADATDNMEDEKNRTEAALSSRELTEWIKEIPALQQVLIMDACHSGKLTTEIEQVATLKSSQIKNLEKMKDRTGLYILAGSESDAVSYESSLYQQGLLTYSLLFGMKGATQDQKGDIDIIDLFQFVSKKVPELASEIGQIQMPEIKIPAESETFPIGSMTLEDQEKISIIESKPIFIQSGFQEMNQYNDPILLGAKIDKLLLDESTEKSRKLIFLDKKTYFSGYTIRGRYQVKENEVVAEVKLFKGDKKIKDFTVREVNSKILSESIINKVLSLL